MKALSLLGDAERSTPKPVGRALARGVCVGHVLQLGGASPLCNRMEVKH